MLTNKQNIVIYAGIANPLNALVDGCPCKSILLSVTNGKIERAEKDGCNYVYTPSETGPAKITVSRRVNNKTKKIGDALFRVKSLPDPVASIGNKKWGDVNRKFLLTQGGILAQLESGPAVQLYFRVDSFSVIIIRNDAVVFSHRSPGPKFDEQVKGALGKLEVDDRILFANISCKMPDGSHLALNPLEFSISN